MICKEEPTKMVSDSHQQELSSEQIAEIYEVISRGYQYDLGKPTMVAQIMNFGYDRETSIQFVDEFEKPFLQATERVQAERKEVKERAKGDFRWAALFLIGSGVITLGTYWIASFYDAGTYIVTTGAFGVGGFFLLRGLIRWHSE